MNPSLKRNGSQRGAVAIAVAVALLVLVGMAGLALDLGQLFVTKTELQNAMDACALSAARELRYPPMTAAQLQRAETRGQVRRGAEQRGDPEREAIAPAAIDVTFSNTLDGTYSPAGGAPPNTQFARCTTRQTGIVMWLMQVWDHDTEDVGATAVASLQPSAMPCGIIPLGMCRKSPPDVCGAGNPGPDAEGLCPGKWYSGRFGTPGDTGNFNWLDFSAHGGGADEIRAAFEGPGVCNIQLGVNEVHGEAGNMQSVGVAWNSRFGLYRNGAGQPDAASSPPDFSGYAYTTLNWPAGRDAYNDFVTKQAAYVSYGPPNDTVARGNQITGLDVANPYHASSSGAAGIHGTRGASRRIVAMPIVDCTNWGPTHSVHMSGWACALMLTPFQGPNADIVLEYLGMVGPTNDKCATYGAPGAGGPKVPTLVQ